MLEPLGLGEYGSVFVKHRVTGRVLQIMSDDDLKELMPLVGDRVRLAGSLAVLRSATRWLTCMHSHLPPTSVHAPPTHPPTHRAAVKSCES